MNEEYEYGYDSEEEEVEYYAVRPNKTRIKKDIAALFALGEELSELSPAQLKTIELPELINKAVIEVSGMPHKSARKRLLKYIAGQLHKIDASPYLERLSRIKNQSVHAVREHHILERWRDRLLAEGNDALTELLDEQPQADRQQLRQLIRNAQKEAQLGKPPKSSRLLYRHLKALFEFEEPEPELDEAPDEDEEFFEEDE